MVIRVELKNRKNMKKTYINPTLDVVEIKYQHQLLAGSTLDLGDIPTDPAISDARELDFDDDEDFDFDEEEGF